MPRITVIILLIGSLSAFSPDEETPSDGSCGASSLLQRSASKRSDLTTVEGTDDQRWIQVTDAGPCDPARKLQGWLHVPKTGSTMERPLMSLQPLDCYWPMPDFHKDINDADFDVLHGHFFSMFRKPSARSFSSFVYFNFQVYEESPTPVVACDDVQLNADPDAYKNGTKGLVTKMLAGQQHGGQCSACVKLCNSGEPDVQKALQRLDGFQFIGITEHWELSMCLFHRMFDVPCQEDWFQNSHPTTYTQYTNVTLEDWEYHYEDAADEAVYGKATEMFWKNILRYDVSDKTCRRTCIQTEKYT